MLFIPQFRKLQNKNYFKVNEWRNDGEPVITDCLLVGAFDELDLLGVHVVVQRLHALQDVLHIAVLRMVKQDADLENHETCLTN